ncbi:hypothetical protein [Aeromonas hydrophila]|uniref:hypothetical protein n=1 Tax=Aeromonas hydrophila TaxID=644 RepID=UPI002B4A843A|nr:hypothetical protein [Aeromonas hydrophila]
MNIKPNYNIILSITAIVISLGALWYARAQVNVNLPDIKIESQVAERYHSSAQPADSEWVFLIPFIVSNSGGRKTTLLKLEQSTTPVMMEVIDDKITNYNTLDFSIELIEETAQSNDRIKAVTTNSTKGQVLSLPIFVNESIDSGSAKSFNLILRLKNPNEVALSRYKVFFSCNVVFDDGTTHRLAQRFSFD